jgi:hypothetical protein
MSELSELCTKLLSTTAINFSTTAAQTIYTVPDGKSCIVSEVWVKASADVGASGTVTIGKSTVTTDFSAGTVANGIINLSNLDADGDVIIVKPLPSATPLKMKTYTAGTVIVFDVGTAGSNVAGTVYLFGFLF